MEGCYLCIVTGQADFPFSTRAAPLQQALLQSVGLLDSVHAGAVILGDYDLNRGSIFQGAELFQTFSAFQGGRWPCDEPFLQTGGERLPRHSSNRPGSRTNHFLHHKSTSPTANRPRLMIAFTLKKATLTRVRSWGLTSECS